MQSLHTPRKEDTISERLPHASQTAFILKPAFEMESTYPLEKLWGISVPKNIKVVKFHSDWS
jgi:hypothetical protein